MPKITFIDYNGAEFSILGKTGFSLMVAARDGQIKGIDADCGGACSCGTCKVHVAEPWLAKLPPKSPEEAAMLDCFGDGGPDLRLSCQIEITEALDGLVVRLPQS